MKALLNKALDYTQDFTKEDLDQVFKYWSVDLDKRHPAPALTDSGEYQGTDLDLASFLLPLVARGAVLNLPDYKARRAHTSREGESVVSQANRHGKLTGLFANKDVFSFGIRVQDANVITSESIGAPRNFMLVDVTGDWYEGWHAIQWKPDAKENDFLTKNELWTGNSVVFKNFVHPALRYSIYGLPYRVVKALLSRFEEEAQLLGNEIAALKARGVELPPSETKVWPKTETADSKAIKIKAFEAELDMPITGKLRVLASASQEGLVKATKRRSELIYGTMPKLRFIARCAEMAFVKFTKLEVPKKLNEKWEQSYSIPGKRNKWDRIKLDTNTYLRIRFYDKTERVAY